MIHPPGFHQLSQQSDQNCENCTHFSHAYDGFCVKYSYKLQDPNAFCESFLTRGFVLCPFCSSKVKEDVSVCPTCQTQLVEPMEEPQLNETELRVQQIQKETQKYSLKFQRKFDLWKQYLLDLSKRNHQLHFSPNSKRMVEIISPSLGDLFQLLVGEEKRIPFSPVFHPDSIIRHKKDSPEELISQKTKIDKEHEKALFFLLENPPKDKIVTKLNDKKLESRLTRITTKNEHFIEETGVNAQFLCFGLLKWHETENSEDILSPILFVPIRINRISLKNPFNIEVLDENIIVNPSLRHKFQIEFRLKLPEYTGEYSKSRVLAYLSELSQLFESRPRWNVTHRSFLGFFAFNKIPLFQDLYDYKPLFYQHDFIQHLGELSHYQQNIDLSTLSEEMMNNDKAINVFSILDIDYSQLQALSYIEKGYSCVIRGPPGTGKSQCIANIIAECLSNRKKVLFVAQKSAALEVVKERLDRTGIGEFCLELHSEKTNKRQVMDFISHTYNTELKPFIIPHEKYQTLNRLQDQLEAYVSAINAPFGENGLLIEQKLAELDTLRDQKEFQGRIPHLEILNPDKIAEIEEHLQNLEHFRDIIQKYKNFPWRLASFTQPPEYNRLEIQDALINFQIQLSQFLEKRELFYQRYSFRNINSPQDFEKLAQFFINFSLKSLNVDIQALKATLNSQYPNFNRFFNLSFYKFRKEIKSFALQRRLNSLKEDISEIEKIQSQYLDMEVYNENQNLAENNRDLFVSHFQELETQLQKIQELQNHPILAKLPIIGSNFEAKSSYWELLTFWNQFWISELKTYDAWREFTSIVSQLKQLDLEFVVKEIIDQKDCINFDQQFRKTYLLQLLDNLFHSNPSLHAFDYRKYTKWIDQFREIDSNVLKINRYRLAIRMFESRPIAPWLYQDDTENEIGILNRELIKRRNIKPLRELFTLCRDYLLMLKPCLLMSPLSIATFLPLETFYQYFDLVIFDEASQICTEDAIGAIVRGNQVVIVGDEKQLPPTRFFASQILDENTSNIEDLNSYESVLEEAMAMGLPVFTLRNHYRSKREDLIVFSNLQYYDHMLNSFPDIYRDIQPDSSQITEGADNSAIKFHYVPEGRYDRGKSRKNLIEAKKVAAAIIAHYKNTKNDLSPGKSESLGVITFNEAQMDAIQRELNNQIKETPENEKLVDFSSRERLFIKNIENVQGNERDVIFFSVGYAYDYEGEFRLNFGALNQQGGERRLNVAITRARVRMEIFCSFIPSEINYQRSQSRGMQDLFGFLQYAYTKTLNSATTGNLLNSSLALYSDLQKSIQSKLEAKGFVVDLSVGKSKNQIDLAILHPFDPSKYILGIILDHGTFAYIPNTTERFRIRPAVLSHLGWNLFHIYSVDWYSNYEAIITEVEKLIFHLATLEKENGKLNEQTKKKPSQPNSKATKQVTTEDSFETIFLFHEEDIRHLLEQDHDSITYRQKFLQIEGVVEYQQKEYDFEYSPDEFHDESNEKLILKYVKEIVEFEGPLHFDLLVTRISDLFGYKKRAAYVKSKLTDMLFSKNFIDLKSDPGIVYPKTPLPFKCRIALHPKQDPRKFSQISTFEIGNAMLFFLQNGGKMHIDGLKRVVMNFFGKRSTSNKAQEHFDSALKKLREKNQIQKIGNVVRISRK